MPVPVPSMVVRLFLCKFDLAARLLCGDPIASLKERGIFLCFTISYFDNNSAVTKAVELKVLP